MSKLAGLIAGAAVLALAGHGLAAPASSKVTLPPVGQTHTSGAPPASSQPVCRSRDKANRAKCYNSLRQSGPTPPPASSQPAGPPSGHYTP